MKNLVVIEVYKKFIYLQMRKKKEVERQVESILQLKPLIRKSVFGTLKKMRILIHLVKLKKQINLVRTMRSKFKNSKTKLIFRIMLKKTQKKIKNRRMKKKAI